MFGGKKRASSPIPGPTHTATPPNTFLPHQVLQKLVSGEGQEGGGVGSAPPGPTGSPGDSQGALSRYQVDLGFEERTPGPRRRGRLAANETERPTARRARAGEAPRPRGPEALGGGERERERERGACTGKPRPGSGTRSSAPGLPGGKALSRGRGRERGRDLGRERGRAGSLRARGRHAGRAPARGRGQGPERTARGAWGDAARGSRGPQAGRGGHGAGARQGGRGTGRPLPPRGRGEAGRALGAGPRPPRLCRAAPPCRPGSP